MQHVNIVIITAEIMGAIALSILYIKSRLPKETIDQQKALIEALGARQLQNDRQIKELTDARIKNEAEIKELSKQIETLRSIPLENIEKHYADILTTQKAIAKSLEKVVTLLTKDK